MQPKCSNQSIKERKRYLIVVIDSETEELIRDVCKVEVLFSENVYFSKFWLFLQIYCQRNRIPSSPTLQKSSKLRKFTAKVSKPLETLFGEQNSAPQEIPSSVIFLTLRLREVFRQSIAGNTLVGTYCAISNPSAVTRWWRKIRTLDRINTSRNSVQFCPRSDAVYVLYLLFRIEFKRLLRL